MKKTIEKYNNLVVYYGRLNKKAFDISPIWCEYYSPVELEGLVSMGIPEEWLKKKIIEPIEVYNKHPYYSVMDKFDYADNEFVFIKCMLFHRNKFFSYGYLTIVQNRVTCVTVLNTKEFDFVINEIFVEDNRKALKKLLFILKIRIDQFDGLDYRIPSEFESTINTEGHFTFPFM